jgi:hypothetical protein
MHVLGSQDAYRSRRIGETACDRFALWNFRKRIVTIADAEESLRRREPSR